MADGTRSKSSSSECLEDAIAKLATSHNSLMASQASLNTTMEDLITRIANLEMNFQVLNQAQAAVASSIPAMQSTVYRMKLDVSCFDGSDATGWIFKITQFFEYHTTPEQKRLTITSFYMEGQALAWYQWMHRDSQLSSWQAFLHALHSRFATTPFEDVAGLLCKLQQWSTVSVYLAEFEALANRIIGLPAPFALSCFISRLKPAIRQEVQVLQPGSLAQAVTYAQLQEDKNEDARRILTFRSPTTVPSLNNSRSSIVMEACLWGFYGGWIFELQWGPLMVIFHHGDAAEDKGEEVWGGAIH